MTLTFDRDIVVGKLSNLREALDRIAAETIDAA